LFPAPADRTWAAFGRVIAKHLRLVPPDEAEYRSYNVLQRVTYLLVVFVLFPLIIVTGLAMSPSFNSAVPLVVNLLGGRQSARTLHFLASLSLVLFLIVHVAMVVLTGFAGRMLEMITGAAAAPQERT
jgi:thiosulfate reductase cytochrome b subunit